MLRFVCTALVFLVVWGTGAAPAAAQWTAAGVRVAPQPGNQSNPLLAPDGAGGVIIAWEGTSGTAGDHVGVMRLSASGLPLWMSPTDILPPPNPPMLSMHPDNQGGAFLIWSQAIYRVDADGSASPIWVGTQDSGIYESVALGAPDDAGGILTERVAHTAHLSVFLKAARIGATTWTRGLASWSASTSLWSVLAGPIASDGRGGAYVITQIDSVTKYGLLSRIDSLGEYAAGWGRGRIQWTNVLAVDSRLVPESVVEDSGLTAVWKTSDQRIWAQRVRPNGHTRPGSALALQIVDGSTVVSMLDAVKRASGGILLAMRDDGVGGAGSSVMRVVCVDSNSTVISDQPVTPPSPYPQIPRAFVSDNAGGAYAVWLESRDGLHTMLFVQHIMADGANAPGWPDTGLVVAGESRFVSQAVAVRSGGHLILAWREPPVVNGVPASEEAVFAAQITPDGVVPTQLALVMFEFTPGQVRLLWSGELGPGRAVVQRSFDATTWEDIGFVDRDGLGRYVFDDQGISPGDHLAYRLASLAQDPLCTAAWVDVPATRLAIRGFVSGIAWPTISLTLPSASPARLELFDVCGRRCDVVMLAGSMGEQRAAASHQLPAGLYLLRLSQGRSFVVGRAVRLP